MPPYNAIIANYNVAHCRELKGRQGPLLDLDYMRTLDLAALPALARIAREGTLSRERLAETAKIISARREYWNATLLDWRAFTWAAPRGCASRSPVPRRNNLPAR